MSSNLAFVGEIEYIGAIEEAKSLERAFVVCGKGGSWWGVVSKGEYSVGDKVRVFVNDAVLPKKEEFSFMKSKGYRVRPCVIRGALSEALVCKLPDLYKDYEVGRDITKEEGVKKYVKNISIGKTSIIGDFLSFVPKTDEPNYQMVPEMVQSLVGKPYVVTEKLDGTSITVYHDPNVGLRVYTRNNEISSQCQLYILVTDLLVDSSLPKNYVIQGELCGPKIQGNVLGLDDYKLFVFNVYLITRESGVPNHVKLDSQEVVIFCLMFRLNRPRILELDSCFNESRIAKHKIGLYENGEQREGVVIRSYEDNDVSFKVLNPEYEG